MIAVMFIVATAVFVIIRVTPGDPAAVMLGIDATPADVAALREQWGLDRPLPVQYVTWLGQLLVGDLGQSIFLDRPVLNAIVARAEPTFFLTLFSILISILIPLPVGVLSAVQPG